MPIECRPSNLGSDVRCEVCGQGFLLYSDRSMSRERNAIRAAVQQKLRDQHNGEQHPPSGFVIAFESEDEAISV
jgi:hypothetical protein